MKKMLSAEELIMHMKEKGITFNEITENEAKEFLCNNNYYMKLASYRANYNKCAEGKRAGKYAKLDFAYLKELSTIDMHLRYYIVEMCLDIEHAIKVQLLKRISNDPREDGYEVVKRFLADGDNIKILREIKSRKSGEYCQDLINKYYPYFPVWVFVEIISFGTLLHFCAFYQSNYNETIINNSLMNVVRDFRNASAHSNCLLNHLTQKMDESKQPHSDVTKFVAKIKSISSTSRTNNLSSLFGYNMTTLLLVYDSLVADVVKKKRYEELKNFMNERVIRNKHYFMSNSKIVGVYNFFKKILDNF